MLNVLRKSTVAITFIVAQFAMYAGQASAQTQQNRPIKFVNVVDSTQGLSDFSQFPAINNQGSVAFLAQTGTDQKVFKWNQRNLNALATATDQIASFSDDVAINDAGTVVFRAALATGRAVACHWPHKLSEDVPSVPGLFGETRGSSDSSLSGIAIKCTWLVIRQ